MKRPRYVKAEHRRAREQEARRIASNRTDYGALLPCPFCREPHEPGRCELADDSAD